MNAVYPNTETARLGGRPFLIRFLAGDEAYCVNSCVSKAPPMAESTMVSLTGLWESRATHKCFLVRAAISRRNFDLISIKGAGRDGYFFHARYF